MDLTFALDLVSHDALLFKQQSIGVDGNFLIIIREIFLDRCQCVSVDNQLSESLNFMSDVLRVVC